jgi:lysozyme family protein
MLIPDPMTNFEIAYKKTGIVEAGYVINKNDPGGETWDGIARNRHPDWFGWKLIDQLKMQKGFPGNLKGNAELERLKKEFYYQVFWNCLRLSEVQNLTNSLKIYDISVNLGAPTAGIILQRTLNLLNQNGKYYKDLEVDGKVGRLTISALNSHPRPDVVFKCLNVLQGDHYIKITEKNAKLEEFINGWFSQRIASIASDHMSNIA